MRPWLPIATAVSLCLSACDPGRGVLIDESRGSGNGWWDDLPDPGIDTGDPGNLDAIYGDATLRIVEPRAGTVIVFGEPTEFAVELLDGEGSPLPPGDVTWSTSASEAWGSLGGAFTASDLPIGQQDLTAVAKLPNGDRLSHTIGGLRVQSIYTGTYSGLFSADGAYNGLTFTCTGSATLSVNLAGDRATGAGNCITSLIIITLPLRFVFDVDVLPDGRLDGDAGADIFGLFTYNFPALGQMGPNGSGMALAWKGRVPFVLDVDATLSAPRISLDPQ